MADYGSAVQSALLSQLASFPSSKHRSSPSNVVYDLLNNNNPSVFLPLAAQRTMQDDLLMDKSKAPVHQQQPDPACVDPPSTPTPSSSVSEDSGSPSGSTGQAPSLCGSKVAMESPILPGLGFPETGGNSLSPSFASTWSSGTANTVDDPFFQSIPSVNGTMMFQNFPHTVFGGGFSPQIGLSQQPQVHQPPPPPPPPQRRSPVSPNQAAFPHRNLYSQVMNSKAAPSSSTAWSGQHNAVWSSGSNPWSGIPAGRDPRRSVGVGMSPALTPISPMKKPYPGNVIAPPKVPRTGQMAPKPWLEDNAFRTDNGNMLPFQVSWGERGSCREFKLGF